jgi:hypothetical protein
MPKSKRRSPLSKLNRRK